ncbi:MAG: arginine--tRNA ligase, partial [Clostridiales bacterium]|nr:arginine--tRNA ligase [Clostridiales bacterium]
MINFKSEIAKILKKEIEGLSLEDLYLLLEIPQDEGMGDYALPCFKLAKELRKAPNVIAEEIKEKISKEGLFMKVEAVSGYVNMFIDRKYYTVNVLGDAIEEGLFEKGPDIGKNRRVLVEYSSPNIAKPFHIGHIRSTVIGHSIYKIYHYLGYDALRLNHLGDYGTQFGKMIVAYRNWGNKEDVINSPIETLLSYYVKFHEEAEKDPGLEEEARKAFNRLE